MAEMTYRKAAYEALHEEMLRDKRVLIIGECVAMGGGSFGVTRGLAEEFGPNRVIDTPISESSFVGMALGMAITGLVPVVEIMFMDFITTCMDPLVNGIAKVRYMSAGQFKVPIVIRTQEGGGGSAGPQHSQCLEAWLAHVPGLKVVIPATAGDAKGLLKSAIRDENPVVFIENKYLYSYKGQVPEGEYTIPLGKANIVRAGNDATVVAIGRMVYEAMKAADKLAADGINVEIIDPRTILPLDKQAIIDSVKKTGRLVVAHEAATFAGIGAEIAASISEEAFDYLDAPIKRVGAAFAPLPFSKPLEQFCLPKADDIVKAVKEVK